MNEQTISTDSSTATPMFRTIELVLYVLSAIQLLLLLRFIFKLFSVNPTGDFSNVVYSITSYIVYPFTTIFESSADGVGSFEWTTILAIIIYWVLAVGIIKLLAIERSPLSRIEQARALSKEKYSH